MGRAYQICKRCVMDTSDADIVFDANGYCNHCHYYFEMKDTYLKHGEAGQKELASLVETIKREGKGKPYDCLIGLSGGVDSSYVAYRVKQLGLRPLAVHFDSGWNSELAVKNIENIVKKLDIDLHTFVCDWKEMQDLQLSYFKAGVINADIPMDHAFLAVLHKIARQKKLRYFISGHNFETEAILPRSWVYNAADAVNLLDIQKKCGKLKLRKYPIETLWTNIYTKFAFGLQRVHLLDFEPYNKEETMGVIEKELGWKYYGGKHYESIFTRFYQGYYLVERFGVDKRTAHLATLVCSGQITREAALEELSKPAYHDQELLKDDIAFVPKKLGITGAEFSTIMQEPIRQHTDFKTDIKQRENTYKIWKVIKKIVRR